MFVIYTTKEAPVQLLETGWRDSMILWRNNAASVEHQRTLSPITPSVPGTLWVIDFTEAHTPTNFCNLSANLHRFLCCKSIFQLATSSKISWEHRNLIYIDFTVVNRTTNSCNTSHQFDCWESFYSGSTLQISGLHWICSLINLSLQSKILKSHSKPARTFLNVVWLQFSSRRW